MSSGSEGIKCNVNKKMIEESADASELDLVIANDFLVLSSLRINSDKHFDFFQKFSQIYNCIQDRILIIVTN
jgi:hypothetical protein